MVRGLLTAGLVSSVSALALAQTPEPPSPPAAEPGAPASVAPPSASPPPAAPPAPAVAPPPAGTPPATAETPPAAEPTPAPTPTPAAAPEPTPVGPDELALPEVTVTQKPIKQIAGPPVAETEIQVAPGPAVGGAGPAVGGTPATGTGTGTGTGVSLGKVPAAVSRVTAEQIEADATRQVQNVLQKQVPGIILTDTAGGGLRQDIQFRGFDASPIGGRSQGLAVYQNGVRINEAFGDTVNLDLIPAIAISDMTVLGANPLYGLNAIGGAIGITMKDGFSFQGGTIDAMGGSFGRGQIAMEAGGSSGTVGAYAALELIRENGFRDFSEGEIERFYGDLGFRGSAVEVHLSLTAAQSNAGVVAASPVELLDVDWNRTFTNPQDTDLEVLMPTLSGKVQATETLTFSGLGYYRKFKSKVIDGNLSEVGLCEDPPNVGQLCLEEDAGEEPFEPPIDFTDVANALGYVGLPDEFPFGSIERINTDAESFGGSVQGVSTADVFSRPNRFMIGASYDHGKVGYDTSSEIGEIGNRFVVTGSGIIIPAPENPDPNAPDFETPELAPRLLETQNDYAGVYFTNSLDVTDAFTLTVGGRYNYARIKISDETGSLTDNGEGYLPDLNVSSTYERFNPMVGGTYKIMKGLTAYGSYSEANRAPTAAELGCAEEDNPCFIESFLTDDPPLEQVVSKTVELGLRGEERYFDGSLLTWSAGLFRTLNQDDIINVASQTQPGRGFFQNAGDTLRQGIELAAGYQTRKYSVYGSYAYVDATFQDDLELPAPNTPDGTVDCTGSVGPDPEQCNLVQDGDTLPGIPRHRFKAGFEYWITPQWKFGSDFLAVSDQYFFGDEANNNRKLSGYTRVDLNTTYKFSENVEAYGLIRNLFDRQYGLYGTFFDTDEANEVTEAAGYGEDFFTDPRSVSPVQPFAIYGGLRVTF
jgi:outer membrane receptor protein involved in Fe transport